jgi:hypothetical protein
MLERYLDNLTSYAESVVDGEKEEVQRAGFEETLVKERAADSVPGAT